MYSEGQTPEVATVWRELQIVTDWSSEHAPNRDPLTSKEGFGQQDAGARGTRSDFTVSDARAIVHSAVWLCPFGREGPSGTTPACMRIWQCSRERMLRYSFQEMTPAADHK